MPHLDWLAKKKIINHHQEVPFRFLIPKYSFGEKSAQNKIIQGDNLIVLKALLPQYEAQIKVIYLDPPYNTGKEGWVYNDNVNDPQIQKWLGEVVGPEGEDLSRHDKWLCMMYPRLKLLYKLLSEDGIIFISIDDHEFKNLKHIMDEIFGEANFITNFAVENNPKGRKNNLFVSESYEYCLLYCKDKKHISNLIKEKESKKFFNDIIFDNEKDKRKILFDNYGEFKQSKRQVLGSNKSNPHCSESNLDRCFTVYYSSKSNDMIFINEYNPNTDSYTQTHEGELLAQKGYIRYLGFNKQSKKPSIPLYSKDTLLEMHANNSLYFKDDGTIYEKDRKQSMQITSLLTNKKFGIDLMTESAKALLEEMFKAPNKFPNPKNVEFIKALISLYPENNITILDPFAGSGTTGHAVMELNKKDNGNRKFILVEMNNYAEAITAERLKIAINGFNKTPPIKSGFTYFELGQELFIDKTNLNQNLDPTLLKEYIFFTETKNNLSNQNKDGNYAGSSNNTAYYIFYEPNKSTCLNHKLLNTIDIKEEQYVIYANTCTLGDDELKRFKIIFKKIPRDIVRI